MGDTRMERAAVWQRHYKEYRRSGLSRKAFCQRFKLKLSTLDYWFARVRRQTKREGLVELKGMVAGVATNFLTLVVAGRFRLEIPQGCDMKLLGEVLRTLGGQS